jgi:hypothetical protein
VEEEEEEEEEEEYPGNNEVQTDVKSWPGEFLSFAPK